MRPILDAAGGPAADADDVAEALRRAGGLVVAYPAAAGMERDALLEEPERYLAAGHADANVPNAAAKFFGTLKVAAAAY